MKRFDFDLQLFAVAPSSQLVSLGIGKESTYGTAVTPTQFLIPSTLNFDGTNDFLDRDGSRHVIGMAEPLTGLFTGKGTMQIEVDPDTIGAILLLMMGAESTAANLNNPTAEAVTTTVGAGTTVPAGFGACTPTAMTNIVKGQALTIGTGATQETVIVRNASTTQFWALFTKQHSAGDTIVNASVVLAYDHTFTLSSPRNSFTAQINEIVSARNCFGAKISQLSMKVDPKAILEAAVNVEYQGEAFVSSPTSPTYSTLHGFSFTTVGNTVSFNSAPLDQAVQAFSIDLNPGLITDYPKFGNGRYRGVLPETQTKVTGTLDLAFESQTAQQAFWGQIGATGPQSDVLPLPLSFLLESVDYINTAVPYQLQIIVPMAKFSNASPTTKAKDYLKQSVKWVCSQTTQGAGDDAKFILTNANSGPSL